MGRLVKVLGPRSLAMRIAGLALVLVVEGCAATGGASTPLPHDLIVRVPAPGIPREIAAFSGKWVGSWDRLLEGTLVVEEIQDRDVVLVYSWGIVPAWGIDQPGFARLRGTFGNDNVLRASLENGAKVSYTMSSNGTLHGRYERGSISTGVFSRSAQK